MCTGGNKAPEPKPVEKPAFVHNPYLDADETKEGAKIRTGRSSLVIPLGESIGFEGRGGDASGSKGSPAVSAKASDLSIRPAPAVAGYRGPRPITPGVTPAYYPGPTPKTSKELADRARRAR